MPGLKICQDLSVFNVHHITRKPEIDSLIKKYADVFKEFGMIEEKMTYKLIPERKTSYSSIHKSTPYNIT